MTDEPTGTLVEDPPPDPPPGKTPMSGGDKVRFVLRGVGQTLITGGLVILLFVVYEVYVTNFFAHREQAKVHSALQQEWKTGKDPLLALPGGALPSLPTGVGIANLYIPRLGRDFAWTIVQGSEVPTDAQLEKGPAHYADTALPGQVGDFAVAGHRVGKGEPFLNLDQLRPGDAVIVETESFWYVYTVKGDVKTGNINAVDPDGVPGREIVYANNGNVIAPVPDHPGQQPTEKLMTMTTCHPKFTATKRMIVHAALTQTIARTSDVKPPAIVALYGKAA